MARLALVRLACIAFLCLSPALPIGQPSTAVQAEGQGLVHTWEPAATAAGNTYIVNNTADTVDADVGNPACADASGQCSLRAAIMQANFAAGPDTITLPAGNYLLTRPGDDDADVLGDLDITDDLTIQGSGSGVTIVDGNGAVTGDRVFQVFSSANLTAFTGLTIQDGKKVTNTFDEGGGLYWDGGGSHLTLNDVVVVNNSARYGGGLFLNYSSLGDIVTIDHLSLNANTATTGAAGGLGVNFGDAAQFTLRNSQVFTNTAHEGGGIYFQGTPSFGLSSVHIENSNFFSNTASLSAAFENHSGDAAVPIVLINDNIYGNHADLYGGAIGNYGAIFIYKTAVDKNSATMKGGGIYNYEGGQLDIEQSTLSGNTAQAGGGIYSELFIHNSSTQMLINSTLSGNTASQDGAGIYAQGGKTRLFNVTIANNKILVPIGTNYTGMGGGLYIVSPATIDGQNMLLADNTHQYGALLPENDDCFGPLNSLGYDLIETPANCLISGTTIGNITGQDPLLGPLSNEGGLAQIESLLSGSPAIDAGQTPFCADANSVAISTDERGFRRPIGARCDIGAVEYSPFALYLPSVEK